ncbi:MAG: extracellular solute-binding protein [Alphaproteobacteria bacterium]|nr:extracellular solute-binding protein [Alphaproteobacteria bacterium]
MKAMLAATVVTVALGAGAAAAQTTVTMWTFLDPNKTSPREVALKQMIERFESANPGIKVKVEPQDFAQMPPKFFLGHRTGSNPDVVWIDAKNIGGLLQSGAGADLGALLVSKWPQSKRDDFFVKAGFDAAKDGAKLYALPLFHGASVVYYRKDLLKEAGIDPTSLKSWEAIREAARKLTVDKDKDGRIDVWGFGLPLSPAKTETTPVLMSMVELDKPMEDDCKARFATPAGERGLRLTADLVAKDKVAPQESLTYNVDDITDQFIAGRYAMAIGSILRYSGMAGKVAYGRDNIGVLPWPTWGGTKSGPMPVSGWWITAWAKSPRLDAATKWIDFMVGAEGVKLWSTAGGQIPTLRSMMSDPDVAKAGGDWMKVVVDSWSSWSWIELMRCNTRTLQTVLNEATHRVVVQNADAMTALKEAEKKFAEAQ